MQKEAPGLRTTLYLASVRPLEDGALARRLTPLLPAGRREKAARFRDGAARRLSLGAGLLLALALKAEGLPVSDTRETALGKPWLPAQPDFHFSLSHSGEMALCAVSERELGCDIERLRRYDPAIARRFFHPEERAWLFSLPEAEQPDAFLRLWTLKESYLKATGQGLSLPLDAFAVSAGEPPALILAADARPWRLRSLREGDYRLALCAEDADGDVPLRRVDFAEVGA